MNDKIVELYQDDVARIKLWKLEDILSDMYFLNIEKGTATLTDEGFHHLVEALSRIDKKEMERVNEGAGEEK